MIYTFYSYKGGVGRSMALANIAEWFYEQGLRVIIVDWDLEAPGIESFFVAPEETEKVRAKPGIIDLLLAYKDQYPLLPLTAPGFSAPLSTVPAAAYPDGGIRMLDGGIQMALPSVPAVAPVPPRKLPTKEALLVLDKHLPPLAYMLYPLRQSASVDGKKRALWLLSAGWRTKDRFTEYGQAVQSFNWSDFYESYHGEAYFEWMRRQLVSPELADVVLIDSRTGLSEMGGVCTRQLADVVIAFTAPNNQGLSGVTRMVASFKNKQVAEARNKLVDDGERPLEVVVVPTRIETSELTERDKFRQNFEEQLTEFPAAFRILRRTFWELLIPYVSKYAYIERLAIGDREAQELENAYKNLAAHLVLLAPEGSTLRSRFTGELRRVFGPLLPRVLLLNERHEGSKYLELLHRMNQAGVTVLGRYTEGAAMGDAARYVAGSVDLFEFVVMTVTRESVHSASFRRQWRQARQHGVCVQLIKGGPDELKEDDLPLWLRGTHIFDPEEEWEELIKTLQVPCIASRVPNMAPEPPEGYVERRAPFEELVGVMLGGGRPGRVGLCGAPSCGKSSLAKAVCQDARVLAAFGDGILWVTLGENPDVASELRKLYVALVGEGPRPADVESLAQVIDAKLEERKCLLVIDDVWTDDALRTFLPFAGRGALLLTTRDRSLIAGVDVTPVAVGELADDETLRIFATRGVPTAAVKRSPGEVASLLCHSPLVAKLAASAYLDRLLSSSDQSGALEYVLDELQARGAVAFDRRDAAGRDQSVTKSVSASLSRLDEAERGYYLKLAVLPTGTDVPLTEIAALWGLQESDVATRAARFASLSLLEYDPQARCVRLGQLMHSFLSAQQHDPALLNARVEEAETLFALLTAGEQASARRVLTRVVHLSRPEDRLPDVRRTVELKKFDLASRETIKLLQRSGIVVVSGEDEGGAVIQLADDSLIQGWNRLRMWLDEDRSFLLWRQSLVTNIAEWESSRRHNSLVLLKGKDLAQARTWRQRYTDDLNESEKLYLVESERVEMEQRRKRQKEVVIVVASILAALITLFAYSYHRSTKEAETLEILGSARIAEREIKNPINESDPSLSMSAYQDAIDKYRALIEANPNYAEAYDGLGDIYASKSQSATTPDEQSDAADNAIKNYLKALALKSDYPDAHVDLGNIYKLKGDRSDKASYDAAIQEYTKAIRLRPEEVDAHYGRGEVYRTKGDRGDKESYDFAIVDFTRIIQLGHPTAEIYFKRGLSYKGKGELQSAVTDIQKALDLPGDDLLRAKAQGVLNDLMVNPLPQLPAAPKIFIQYNDEDDGVVIDKLAADLKAEGYQVVGRPQLTAGKAFEAGDIRCFNETDRKSAEAIGKVVEESLANQGFARTIKVRWLKFNRNVPLGNIEVWIPPLRLSPSALEDVATQPGRNVEPR